MARTQRPAYGRPIGELVFSPWVLLPLSVILGAFFALQFFHLTARYVKLIFALVVLIGLIRLSFTGSMALFLVLWIAPTSIFLGDTNVIFIGTVTALWLIRMQLRIEPRPVRTPIDWAIWVYLGLHLLSFVNIHDALLLQWAGQNMKFMVAGVVFYFLIVNAFRTEQHLLLALRALTIAAVIVDLSAITEYYFGFRMIPAWFLFAPATLTAVQVAGRTQGVFGFHGLLADFSAMSFYIQLLLAMRARSRWARFFYLLLAAAGLHMIAISVNRGGAVIWVIGGLMFAWHERRRIRWAIVAIVTPAVAALIGFSAAYWEQAFSRIRIVGRLIGTQVVRGIPDTRIKVWADIIRRIPEHLWIGHGPFIDLRRGIGQMYWPHNAYLFYLFTTGVCGLLSYFWILGKMMWVTRPHGSIDFRRASLARAVQAIFFIQIVMFALSQMRDEHQRGNVYYYYMWILFGLGTAASRIVREQRRAALAAEPTASPGEENGEAPPKPARFVPEWRTRMS